MTRQGEPLIILASDAEHCFATWDRVLINIWLGEMTVRALRDLFSATQEFIASGGGEAQGCLTVIGSECPSPHEQARAHLAMSYVALDAGAVHHYLVPEGSPARVALFRGIALALSSAALVPLGLRFAVSVQEASHLIAPILSNTSGRAPVLRSIVEEVRSHMSQLARRPS